MTKICKTLTDDELPMFLSRSAIAVFLKCGLKCRRCVCYHYLHVVNIPVYLSSIEQSTLTAVRNSITETRCTTLGIVSLEIEKSWFTCTTALATNVGLKGSKKDHR